MARCARWWRGLSGSYIRSTEKFVRKFIQISLAYRNTERVVLLGFLWSCMLFLVEFPVENFYSEFLLRFLIGIHRNLLECLYWKLSIGNSLLETIRTFVWLLLINGVCSTESLYHSPNRVCCITPNQIRISLNLEISSIATAGAEPPQTQGNYRARSKFVDFRFVD